MKTEFLHKLLESSSVSGWEAPLQRVVLAEMEDAADQIFVDGNGSVAAVINPDAPVKVLLDGHADEVGLVVTCANEQGLLHVAKAGGPRLHCWPGQKVRIFTDSGVVYGAVALTEAGRREDLQPRDLLIDIGVDSRQQAEALVHTGDTVVPDTDWRMLQGDRICSRALDDKAGVFVVMEALKKAKEKGCTAGVYAVSATGEETTKRGASWMAGSLWPDMAIVVDVTYASDAPGTRDADSGRVRLGGGPVLCCGGIISRPLNRLLEQAAEACGIAVQHEVSTARTFTDADVIQPKRAGIPVALVSIPLRYMHSPAEVGSLTDLQQCIDLIAAFLCQLTGPVELNPLA